MKEFDAIIIGFGKGGKTLAAELANRGKEVAIIERSDKMYGGTCINIGCIPTKTLVHQSKIASTLQHPSWEERKAFYREAIAIKEEVTTALRQKNYHNLADHPHVTVYTGIGSFVSSDTVSVRTLTEEILLRSNRIVINTGAEAVVPAIKGVTDNPLVYTSTSLMELSELPARLVIVGGGYIGLEFASMFASFGSKVTILESYPELIMREDRDIAASVKEILEKKGIEFRMNAKVQSINYTDKTAVTQIIDLPPGQVVELESEAVLLATGRKPNTEQLNLKAAGIEQDERGAILVDEYLKTSNPQVYAIGDVKGGLQFTYISLDDYRIIRDSWFGEATRRTTDRQPVSYSVFIDPPLSHIGINEEEARRLNLDVIIKKTPVAEIPRAKTLGETEGLLKAVIDKQTRKIIGCTLLTPESSEVINTVAIAMKAGLDNTFLSNFIFTHPSMSEALNDLFSIS